MRVFVAGASGALGSRLVPRLVDQGHEVTGTCRSAGKVEQIRSLGASPVVLDVLDRTATVDAVRGARPDAVVHEATALSDIKFSRNMDRTFAVTKRLRTAGTDNLVAAVRAGGMPQFVAQSYASSRCERTGGWVKTEDDPLDPNPPPSMRQMQSAMRQLDDTVTDAGGIALRYGGFYGAAKDALIGPVRKRRFPIIGDGAGVTSFVHLDDAATATVAALEHDGPGIYNVVDDDPAAVRDWLPVLAQALGAKPPRHVPRWLARLIAGEAVVVMQTESRGASNAKAKRELGWTPSIPSWRQGFPRVCARSSPVTAGTGGGSGPFQ